MGRFLYSRRYYLAFYGRLTPFVKGPDNFRGLTQQASVSLFVIANEVKQSRIVAGVYWIIWIAAFPSVTRDDVRSRQDLLAWR